MKRQELVANIFEKKSALCVGLDPDINKMPSHLPKTVDGVVQFCSEIIESTSDVCVAYKPNFAFFEALGPDGYAALADIKSAIPSNCFSIADAKRGDIGNTSQMYAKAILNKLDFDAITIAPYMGKDSIVPFIQAKGKWVIVLGLTSNAGSADFQMQKLASGKFLFEEVIDAAAKWGSGDQMMFVIGATHPSDFTKVRAIVPNHFLLVPGIGAQGGDIDEVMTHGANKDIGLLINASRSIIYASNEPDFAMKARQEAININNSTLSYFN